MAFRLHEIVAHHIAKSSIAPSKYVGEGVPKRGPELATIILEALRGQIPGDLSEMYDTDRARVAEDLEEILQKAAREWAKVLKAVEKK